MKPRIYEPTEKDFSHNGLGVLTDTTRCDVREQANGAYEIELEHPLLTRFADYFTNGYQIKAKPNDLEEYHIFEIKKTYKDTVGNNILIYGQSRTYKLGNRQVQHVEIESKTGTEAMQLITNGMDSPSDVTLFSDITTISSTTLEARNVLNCVAGERGSLLQYWGGEIKREPFKLSLLKRRGRDNVGTVRYGKDLDGLKITFDWQSIVTRCLPYADLQDENDGQTKRIYGTAVDSELIHKYPDIYAKHIQFTEEQGVKDLESLDRVASSYFTTLNPGIDKPKISVELEIMKLTDSEEAEEFAKLRNYGLFDTFNVYYSLYDIYLTSKITEVVYDSLNEKNKKIYAGDAQVTFYKQQDYEFQEVLKSLAKKDYMSQFVDYVTDLINGVVEGSVLQYPKNNPHTTYYLDTASRETAKDVIAINNQGIGFSRTGWRGPFVNAWSIDGVLNADFILAGKIIADVFETSFNALGDQLKLVSGALQAWNNGQKIMELTKQGLEFWNNEKELGTMGTRGEPFPDMIVPDPNNPGGDGMPLRIDGKAIIIDANGKGDYIAISPKTGYGIVMAKHGWIYQKGQRISLTGDDLVTVQAPSIRLIGDVDIVGSLKINGTPVTPGTGGGGGGWNGTYPPSVTSSSDKFAWQAWASLRGKGYSEAAAAGILGNIQGEVGSGMNPDTSQIGGPAYGAVQWDGSAYPLVGSPTWDGREYVQRLMSAAGITLDYTTMVAQIELVEWCMFNGQWIGQVSPTTVAAFKSATSPATAAHAFELNFERPASAHPERQTYAQNWYNKFSGLAISQVYIAPIDNPITITSEYGWRTSPITGQQELHNGIDLIGGTGNNTNIYASGTGEVIYAGWENSYGNYVVIRHADGLYTGYAHNSALSVSVGQNVTQGQKIANMGTTGDSTGPHCHFQFFTGGLWPTSDKFINPRQHVNF